MNYNRLSYGVLLDASLYEYALSVDRSLSAEKYQAGNLGRMSYVTHSRRSFEQSNRSLLYYSHRKGTVLCSVELIFSTPDMLVVS
jgi:hypothetical protein